MDTIQLALPTSVGQIDISAKQDAMADMFTQTAIASVGGRSIIRKRYSFNNEATNMVYAQDDDHSVTFVVKDTDDPDIGEFIVWHDNDAPQSFRLDLNVLAETMELQRAIIDGPENQLDVTGRRNPPDITAMELYEGASNLPAYQMFMQGRPSATALAESQTANARKPSWKCWIWCTVPACGIVCLFWAA